MPTEVKMPQLGESVTEGTIGRWLKQPGDPVARFEPLLEVSTDKVDTEITSTVDGTVLELLIPEGETVRVGTLLARIEDAGDADAAPRAAARLESTSTEQSAAAEQPTAAPPISPVVARLAAEHGLDLSRISGTGTNGRVTKKDVEQYLASGGTAVGQPVSAALQETMLSGPKPSVDGVAPGAPDSTQASEVREQPPLLAPGD